MLQVEVVELDIQVEVVDVVVPRVPLPAVELQSEHMVVDFNPAPVLPVQLKSRPVCSETCVVKVER